MKYIVIELQTNSQGAVANLVTSHDTREQAESKYYTVLASAAVSNVTKHAAIIADSEGGFIASHCYSHGEQQ